MHQSIKIENKLSFNEYTRLSALIMTLKVLHCIRSGEFFFLLAFSIETYFVVVYIYTIFRGFAET